MNGAIVKGSKMDLKLEFGRISTDGSDVLVNLIFNVAGIRDWTMTIPVPYTDSLAEARQRALHQMSRISLELNIQCCEMLNPNAKSVPPPEPSVPFKKC